MQDLNKVRHRQDKNGELSPYSGNLICADCGCRMNRHSGHYRKGADWKGLPNGKMRYEPESFNCSTYEKAYDKFVSGCSSHHIQTKAVEAVLLETIRYACRCVAEEFLALVDKYTDIKELTPAIVNEFVEKILVHKAERIDGERVVELEIYLRFVGKMELPAQEMTPEEIEEHK